MRWVQFAFVMGLLGCGADAKQPAQHPGPAAESQPIPADLSAEVQTAARVGAAIYAQDQASWKATDVMLEHTHGKPDPRAHGWVTLEQPSGFRVLFVGLVENKPLAFYEVKLGDGQPPRISDVNPPAPLDPDAEVRFKAIHAADPPRDPDFLLCSKTYNSVVLPASLVGKQGWLVYLLAATHEPKVAVVGGHHRFLISPDGSRILEHTQLSRSCLNLKQDTSDGFKPEAMFASHLVTSAPIETHVFVSLQHHMPFVVLTSRGNWLVDGDKIRFMGPQ